MLTNDWQTPKKVFDNMTTQARRAKICLLQYHVHADHEHVSGQEYPVGQCKTFMINPFPQP